MECLYLILMIVIIQETSELNPDILKYENWINDAESIVKRIKADEKKRVEYQINNMGESIPNKRETHSGRFPTEPNARRYVDEYWYNKTSNVEGFTKYPHPHETPPPVLGDDWNTNMEAPFPPSEVESEKRVDTFFNNLCRILSEGERIKMTILTTNHQWFKMDVWPCFEGIRKLLGDDCVHYRDGTYAQKYGFVLMNFCNAAWLTETRIHDVIRATCKTEDT